MPTSLTLLDLDVRRAEMYPERRLSMETIINALPIKPVSCSSLHRARLIMLDNILPSHWERERPPRLGSSRGPTL